MKAYERKLTDIQVEAITNGLREGISFYALAKAFSVSRSTIRYYKKKIDKLDGIKVSPLAPRAPAASVRTPPVVRVPYRPKITNLTGDEM